MKRGPLAPVARRMQAALLLALLATGLPAGALAAGAAQALVASLDLARFRQDIADLAGFGTRHYSQDGNTRAGDWLQAQLESFGYVVERHRYTYLGRDRDNIHATKVGRLRPDAMYIVSAHMDSINLETNDPAVAPGADDDASGSSLVLEAARAFSPAFVETEYSVRFVFWNNEETGLNGSMAYVADRRPLQGVEDPPGSGRFPEPRWLGMIQHDMILFDHGLPPGPFQIADADIDVEYQAASTFAAPSMTLAAALAAASASHSTDYPAEIGSNMNWTDSRAFWNDCAAVSVRENRRLPEIENGSNPHWHQTTDLPETYSDEDYMLGFNALQMTVGAVAELAVATITDAGISMRLADPDRLDWIARAPGASWNVYRGDLSELRRGGAYTQAPGSNAIARQDCEHPSPFLVDPDAPPRGGAAFYLVTAQAAGVESGLGANSLGGPRPNDSRCP